MIEQIRPYQAKSVSDENHFLSKKNIAKQASTPKQQKNFMKDFLFPFASAIDESMGDKKAITKKEKAIAQDAIAALDICKPKNKIGSGANFE